jgi:hypothetical protein
MCHGKKRRRESATDQIHAAYLILPGGRCQFSLLSTVEKTECENLINIWLPGLSQNEDFYEFRAAD